MSRSRVIARKVLLAALLVLTLTNQAMGPRTVASAGAYLERRQAHVLLLGIDGCRYDALMAADAPHVQRLARTGACAPRALVRLPGRPESLTVSGPGWNTVLTGFWPHQHGTLDNRFPPPPPRRPCPDVFARLRRAAPGSHSVSLAAWPPINQFFATADHRPVPQSHDPTWEQSDRQVAAELVECVEKRSPQLALLYLSQVDQAGHDHGFDPANPRYLAAIARADVLVGHALAAIEARRRRHERWLVVVTTDHGGQGRRHDFRHPIPAEVQSFLVVHGEGVRPGLLPDGTALVDVVPTVLAYLGLPVDPDLPGSPRGLAPNPSAAE